MTVVLGILAITSAYATCYYPTTVGCATVGQYITNGGTGYLAPGCAVLTSAYVQAQGWKAAATTSNNGQQGYSSTVYNSTLLCRQVYVKIYNNCTGLYNYIYVDDPDHAGNTVPDSSSAACF
jgi:hypothetical protein